MRHQMAPIVWAARYPAVPDISSAGLPQFSEVHLADDATANDGAGLDVVSKVPAISVPLHIAGAAHAMSIDPFVDSLRDRSPRGVRCGVAEANAARGEPVPPKHARDVLDTAEDVGGLHRLIWLLLNRSAMATRPPRLRSRYGFCEHTADVGHQRDHPRQHYDIGEAVGKRCVICAPLEHVQVREGARGRGTLRRPPDLLRRRTRRSPDEASPTPPAPAPRSTITSTDGGSANWRKWSTAGKAGPGLMTAIMSSAARPTACAP